MKNMTIFNYKNLGNVRVIRKEGGEPWFCLSDICDILGLTTTSKVAERLESGGDEYYSGTHLWYKSIWC